MTLFADTCLKKRLLERQGLNNLRALAVHENLIDFASNDYLGLGRSQELKEKLFKKLMQSQNAVRSSSGSRLLFGHSKLFDEVEEQLAFFHNSQDCLIVNSGYTAALCLVTTLLTDGATALFDTKLHASFWDAAKMATGKLKPFRHNDLNHLESVLKKQTGNVYIFVESVYSNGDIAPLKQIADLADRYVAALIVDEAHAFGIFGKNGKGLADELAIEGKVFARLYPLGKAAGAFGCTIAGSRILKKALINFARPFIYSTALPPMAVESIRISYEALFLAETDRKNLAYLIDFWKSELQKRLKITTSSQTQIQPIYIQGNAEVKSAAIALRRSGLDVRAILAPTVKKGEEHLRICLHSFNTIEEIEKCLQALQTLS